MAKVTEVAEVTEITEVTEVAEVAKAWSKARRNASRQFGLWSVILCMVVGLTMKMRPLIILERAAIAFFLSAALGYILILIIQMNSRSLKKAPVSEPAEADDTESQDEQEYTESEA